METSTVPFFGTVDECRRGPYGNIVGASVGAGEPMDYLENNMTVSVSRVRNLLNFHRLRVTLRHEGLLRK